jgi:DNA-binding transcriptional MerR regulator/DNA-binding MarR family transcriptional regulator
MTVPEAGRAFAEDAPVFVISVAAELAGMHAQTLRQYDRLGLVSPGRTAGGGRRYSPRDVALLREVQRLSQEDGVTLAGIKRIIDLESRVEALQTRVAEMLDELELSETRRIAAESAVSAAYRRDVELRPGGVAAQRPRLSGNVEPPPVVLNGVTVDSAPRAASAAMDSAAPDSHAAFVALEREIALLLRRSRAISGRLAGELHQDLDGAAYGLLVLLDDAGPLRASDVVARLGLDKSTVSRQVANLAALGLVDRAADPDDGRAQVLTPSAEGAARLARIREARRARWEQDLAGWPASDVATLGELLGRLNRLGEAHEADGDQPR